MDAVKYWEEAYRMCNSIENCKECPLNDLNVVFPCKSTRSSGEICDPENVVGVVEQWAAEHPIKTRQSEFLKTFPKPRLHDSVIDINPCYIENDYQPRAGGCIEDCEQCRKDYWLEEVE